MIKDNDYDILLLGDIVYLFLIFILTIWHSVLFFGKELGLSVILFILPLSILIVYCLKSKNLINNKKGLLFLIPIILLSFSYSIFENEFFGFLNILVIPTLFILMFIFTIKPTFNVIKILTDYFNILIEPFRDMGKVISDSTKKFKGKLQVSKKTSKILKSLLIVIPITIIVLYILSTADAFFGKLVYDVFKIPIDIINNITLSEITFRLIRMFILFLYIGATVYFLSDRYQDFKYYIKESNKKDSTTIIVLLIVLNLVYLIFNIVQIKSLGLLTKDINYAQYAREGFFQLMIISFINIIVILQAKSYITNEKLIKILSLIMVFFTFIIILSANYRMYLYEAAYGYTILRLLVYIILFTEIILTIPLILYIINKKYNIVKATIVVVITIYTFINLINIDGIIAKRNIDRYFQKDDIDLEYLTNYRTDNIKYLNDFYEKVDDYKIKRELQNYFRQIDTDYTWQDFSLSKYNAKKEIKTSFKRSEK